MSVLSSRLEDYLCMRRGLGFKLISQGTALQSFVQFMEQNQAENISKELAIAWALQTKNPQSGQASCRLGFVRPFAKYCHAIDQCSEVPAAGLLPVKKRRSTPYYFSERHIFNLLEQSLAQPCTAGVSGKTTHCILSLICSTGLRINEALRLDVADFDTNQNVLRIRETKFGKSRLIPLHSSVATLLSDYVSTTDNRAIKKDLLGSLPLFRKEKFDRPSYDNIYRRFRILSRDFEAQPGKRKPKLHDLRHRFAVKTLLNWYQNDVDIERWLPVLSTYMGHVEVRDTYWYISACPELMAMAKHRLEAHTEGRV